MVEKVILEVSRDTLDKMRFGMQEHNPETDQNISKIGCGLHARKKIRKKEKNKVSSI